MCINEAILIKFSKNDSGSDICINSVIIQFITLNKYNMEVKNPLML